MQMRKAYARLFCCRNPAAKPRHPSWLAEFAVSSALVCIIVRDGLLSFASSSAACDLCDLPDHHL
jgi:hypothetical protein